MAHQHLGFVEKCLPTKTSFSHCPHLGAASRLGASFKLGGTQLGQLMGIALGGIPFQMMMCSARKGGRKEEKVCAHPFYFPY